MNAGESGARAADLLEGERLEFVSSQGCESIELELGSRELWTRGKRSVDARARYWRLAQPTRFDDGRARARYRMGSGWIEIRSELSADHTVETVALRVEQPIERDVLAHYLPGAELPCTKVIRYARVPLSVEAASVDLDDIAAFDEQLHAAEEMLYDRDFERARSLLESARKLRPADMAPYWMLARLTCLELEEGGREALQEERLAGYQTAVELADTAVRLAPERAEGYLWRGIALGRRATTLGNLRVAFQVLSGRGGPARIESALLQAATLPFEYRFFDVSPRADAFYALAQYYRLAPDGWYMQLAGSRGDRSRAVEYAERAATAAPNRADYALELAVALLCRSGPGDRDRARSTIDALLALPPMHELDRIDQRHAEVLRSSVPEDVCWYSRDRFEESSG